MAFKILSLDGGGSWALIQARVLLDIYGDVNGHELLRRFDLVIGNSGGSLVLAALCNDMKLSEIIGVFTNKSQREKVFSKLTFWEKLNFKNIASLSSVLGPKYDTARKLKGLISVLTDTDHLFREQKIQKPVVETPLNELPGIIGKASLQIVIVGFDYYRERATFFRSNTSSYTDKFNNGKYYQVTLSHAIHSSSNAPINYFDSPAEITISLLGGNERRSTLYWDGAVSGFNNPVLAGLVEAITNNHKDPKDYAILSLGTGTGSRPMLADYATSTDPAVKAVYERNKNNPLAVTDGGHHFFKDIQKMSTSILGDPPDSATFIAYSMLDPSLSNTYNLIRINPCIKPEKRADGLFVLPEVYQKDSNGQKKFISLMDMDMDAVKDEEVELIVDLCDKFIVAEGKPCLSNQLIRGDSSSDPLNILGQASYPEAKSKWLQCM